MLLVLFPFLVWSLLICRRGNVAMRSIAAIAFCLVCATSYHLFFPERTYEGVFSAIGQLYKGGIAGSSAGVIGGALAMLLRGILGGVLSFVVLLILAAILLLRSMEITLMGLYNAFLNRPRYEEEKEPEEVRDNAQELVNHIAKKRMERRQRQNQRKLEEEYEYYEEEEEDTPDSFRQDMNHIFSSRREEIPRQEIITAPIIAAPDESKQEKLMRQIQEETDVPVVNHNVPEEEEAFDAPQAEVLHETVAPMPELKVRPTKPTKKQPDSSAQEVAKALDEAAEAVKAPYCFPPINLLRMPPRNGVSGTEEMKENSRRLNETLESFNIAAHIVNVTRGPSVTRYEVELEKGVKLSKLTNCADDIALSLGASGVRIAAVPGKISVVGIEVPNRAVTMVSLREVIDSNEFNSSKGKSTFAVGKDIGGSCIIGNIAKMPHMLIAGTTGSGKSVCMNSIIISLLYKAGPEDVKLIMVDPKMVELANYNGIPHLMIPVVTDPKKAAGALQWAVTEMMRRYKTMSDAGVRDLESYNTIIEAEGGQKVPQLIVIIDELADLMMVAAKEVEDSICRIAQMGRASGVHLVIATQRPSADVITGLMKANIPSRIAFSVASAMESRIILDTQGAEKLVGKGDMLFAPIGAGKPHRVQGCFVSDAEVLAVTSYVKEHFVADYDQTVLADIEKKAQQTGKKSAPPTAFEPEPNMEELEGDELLPQAVDVVLETGQASVSMLQRRLKLGYARAARIVDEMEEKGIVGPFQGSKPRNILVTKEQWESMKDSGFGQMSMDDLDDGAVPEDLPF
ncbi:MAG: DNA translocase FtsK [Oscillospiraceae bacterium]|nr:DNA translocase FtsK [Oscillospiraceae bacterium]